MKVSSYSLNIMVKGIIRNKKLKCEQSPTNKPVKALLPEKVIARTENCDSYLKSIYNVIYPGGINPRKK